MAIFDRCVPRRDQQPIDVERRPPRMPQIERRIVAPRTCLLPQPGDAGPGNLGLAIRAIGMESRWLAIRATGMTNPNASVASTSMLQDVRGQPDHNNGRSCSEHSRLFVRGSEVELVHDRPPPRRCSRRTPHPADQQVAESTLALLHVPTSVSCSCTT